MLRDVLLNLHNCEYPLVLQFLEKARCRLLLDPVISSVYEKILSSVKRRVVVEVSSNGGFSFVFLVWVYSFVRRLVTFLST